MPRAATAPRSGRRSGGRGGGRGLGGRRSGPLRAAGTPAGRHRDRRGDPRCSARGPVVRHRPVRHRGHQRPRGRSSALQQVEFVLAHRRLRACPRRLVAQPGLYGTTSGNAIHGHRLVGVHAHPPRLARPVQRPIPALRADGPRLLPQGSFGAGGGEHGAGRGRRVHGARDRSRRGTRSHLRVGLRGGPGRRRRDQPDHRARRHGRSVSCLLRRDLHAPSRPHCRWTMGGASSAGRRTGTTSSRHRSSIRGPRPPPARTPSPRTRCTRSKHSTTTSTISRTTGS